MQRHSLILILQCAQLCLQLLNLLPLNDFRLLIRLQLVQQESQATRQRANFLLSCFALLVLL